MTKKIADVKAEAGIAPAGQAVNLKELSPKQQIKTLLKQNQGIIRQALPRHMNAERLLRVAQTAATTTPKLLECYVPSLLGGIMQCAQMGLEPNTILGHAYLVPFNNRDKNRVDVQVIIGYKGYIDLARRSGQIVSIAAHAVRENDDFDYAYGLDERLEHRPFEGERGEITHVYAVAKLKDGGHAFEVMSRAQIEAIKLKSQSRGKWGPWKDHFEEMARKTAVRRIAKYLPLSVEFATAGALDELSEANHSQDLEMVLDGDYDVMLPALEGDPAQDDDTPRSAPTFDQLKKMIGAASPDDADTIVSIIDAHTDVKERSTLVDLWEAKKGESF